ncbi:MAG: hypothetical protein L0Z62_49655 [Gemmataceae bacterium]|nr:hypothetical protein [Gemmataceae bacterium]
MGKPYLKELASLADTYAWAVATNIAPLMRAVLGASRGPLICVGSGGSLTAAHFAAALHSGGGQVAKAVTPLEAVSSTVDLRNAAVLILSAQGSNPDVLGAFRAIARREPRLLLVVCARTASPLVRLATGASACEVFEFDAPTGKDGFLATNSLLATMVLLERVYGVLSPSPEPLPTTLAALAHPGLTSAEFSDEVERRFEPLSLRDTLVVLHGLATQPAAADLESKFTEAALGHLQPADYRHFAHGRHYWLARHAETSAVLSLESEDDRVIADKTLSLLPSSVPFRRIETGRRGSRACLAALVHGLHLVGAAGRARGIDPGMPRIPAFGRALYHLNVFARMAPTQADLDTREAVSIERKASASIQTLTARGELPGWRDAYARFMKRLRAVPFAALLFDYDGTLRDGPDRDHPPSAAVAAQLARLAVGGVRIGIATGRGGSVRDALRRCLPSEVWSQVTVGYRNGAEVGLLGDDDVPGESEEAGEELEAALAAIQSEKFLRGWIRPPRPRPGQVTVYPNPGISVEQLWEMILQVVLASRASGAQVLRSSHSVDILAPGISKRRVLHKVRGCLQMSEDAPVLCVGDRGRWPGNDYELLREPCSLSVDETSPDPETCWAVASAGRRGPSAALEFLTAIAIDGGACRIKL